MEEHENGIRAYIAKVAVVGWERFRSFGASIELYIRSIHERTDDTEEHN